MFLGLRVHHVSKRPATRIECVQQLVRLRQSLMSIRPPSGAAERMPRYMTGIESCAVTARCRSGTARVEGMRTTGEPSATAAVDTRLEYSGRRNTGACLVGN